MEIKERTYEVKSRGQRRVVQEYIFDYVPLKDFDEHVEVVLINPVTDAVAQASFRGAHLDWYICIAHPVYFFLTFGCIGTTNT